MYVRAEYTRSCSGPRIASTAPRLKDASELGTVAKHGDGWRALLQFGRGVMVIGPTHCAGAARKRAEADLAQARLASTRDEMQRCLSRMSSASRPDATTSLADPLPQQGLTHPRGVEQPAGQVRKRLRTKTKPDAANENLDVAMDSGVLQPIAATQLPRCSESNVATECGALQQSGSSNASEPPAEAKSTDDQKKLLLQLRRSHYDAIKEGRKKWEARALFDDEANGGRRNWIDKLATVGREVVLQSGAGTNDRVRIAEVRRYTPESC